MSYIASMLSETALVKTFQSRSPGCSTKLHRVRYFYRAAWDAQTLSIATRKLSVCLPVRPSVKRVNCDKTEERSVQIPYERLA